MDINSSLTQNVDTLFSNLENFTQNEGLIGKPVNYGDKTFIPVISVTLGYGTGNTAGKNQAGNANNQQGGLSSNMAGGALGLGARLSTDAVLLIDKDNVSVIPVNTANTGSQLMDKIPQILTGMNKQGQQGQQGQQNQSQNQQQQ
ncbi:GerW family sporulation protein [Pseudobacteroides cellulosolvens]|uniref:Sporulation protein YtfJ n=1 Tax=Pseudobacteroides cellulosolvens ATCC 35603 = DSM 2933 TaxID=398512 RepID=A0A0L6JQ91_9FIRM|nr:spore germination protein GerW family protein [Pseudobacteroides cellulosolvens]KNY27532.1 Sporulation protein YtfJ [Pseudobacteroides cellulosolvens ATCC 35603 = DSM 2933]